MAHQERVLYFHAGLPKTGTTFLQNEILPQITHLRYLGKPKAALFTGPRATGGAFAEALSRSATVWDELGKQIFGTLFEKPGEEQHDSRGYLISDETWLSAQPYLIATHLSKLKDLAHSWGFSQIRVLVSVRRQDTAFASSYAQSSSRRYGASQAGFEVSVRRRLDKTKGYFRPRTGGIRYAYDVLFDELVGLLGKENVLLLPYELMQADLELFLKKWLAFLQAPPGLLRDILASIPTGGGARKKRNVRRLDRTTWQLQERRVDDDTRIIHLPAGRVFDTLGISWRIPLRWPDLGRGKQIELTPELSHEIMSAYQNSNLRLAAAADLTLDQYGYL